MTEATVEGLSVAWDHLGSIARTVGDLTGSTHLAYELIQNAEDAPGATKIRFDVTKDALVVWNDGLFSDCRDHDVAPSECGWLHDSGHRCEACEGKSDRAHLCDLHSFRLIAGADKARRAGTVGAFGIGFTAVYQMTDEPELMSGAVHWRRSEVREEARRIIPCSGCSACADPIGTTFILPWAFDGESEFRQKAILEPIDRGFPARLLGDLVQLAPSAILFLNSLEEIEIRKDGVSIARVSISHESGSVVVSVDGTKRRWWMFSGEVAGGQEFASRSERYANRARTVTVAISDDQERAADGRLFAFLPTSEGTHLPVHINADFIPRSDRSRIRTEAKDGDWNREAVLCAGSVIAENLDELYSRLGAEQFWALMGSVSALTQFEGSSGVDGWLADLWSTVADAGTTSAILPTTAGAVVAPEDAWYLVAKDEEMFTDALDDVGFKIADPAIRPVLSKIKRKDDLGIDNMSADWIVRYAEDVGKVSDALIEQMWSEIEILVGGNAETADHALASLNIGVTVEGDRVPLVDAYKGSASVIETLSVVGADLQFVDEDRMLGYSPSLVALVEPLTVAAAIDALEELSEDELAQGLSRLGPGDMIELFESLSETLAPDDRDALAALAIFPARDGYFPLSELSLPGGFTDPLGLAGLIDGEIADRHREFLEDLGARELDLARYVADRLPGQTHEASDNPILWRDVISEISEGLGEVLDDDRALAVAKRMPLVETTQGFVRGNEAYFASPDLEAVLGPDYPAADPNRLSIRAMQRELGTVSVARSADLVRRVEDATAEAPSAQSVAAVTRIVRYIATNGLDEDTTLLAELKRLQWMPVKGEAEWFLPGETAAGFEEYLYASEADFLALSMGTQREATSFLVDGLDVQSSAEISQIVGHLLHLAEGEADVHPEIFNRLMQASGDPAIRKLRGRACVPLGHGSFARPADLFLDWHPFGRFRYRIGEGLVHFRALWDEIGVRPGVSSEDAIAVLTDISAEFGPQNRRLADGDDVAVLEACWAMLDESVDAGEPELLEELADQKCVRGSNGVLVEPPRAVFEDDPLLADIFRDRLGTSLVIPPDRGRRAMAAAGVRSLRASARAEIQELANAAEEQAIGERILSREHALRRVFAEHNLASDLDAFLGGAQILRVDRIAVVYAFSFSEAGHPLKSGTVEKLAHYDDAGGVLYVVDRKDGPKWLDVARELVRAVAPDVIPSSLIPTVRQVLEAASASEAEVDLDASGVARLAEVAGEAAKPRALESLGDEGDSVDVGPLEPTSQEDPSGSTEEVGDLEQADSADGDSRASVAPGSTPSDASGAGGADNVDDKRRASQFEAGLATEHSAAEPESRDAATQAPVAKPRANGVRSSSVFRSDSDERPGGTGQSLSDLASQSWDEQSQARLRSYVTPSRSEKDAGHAEANRAIDRAGVAFVLGREEAEGRRAREMPHDNPGYDIQVVDSQGEVTRFIEVKSVRGMWGDRGVGLTPTQYRFGHEKRSLFWIYVVEQATSDAPTLYEIQDPIALIDEYRFDGGWAEVALTVGATDPNWEEPVWYTEGQIEAAGPGTSCVPVFSDLASLGHALEGAEEPVRGWLVSAAGRFGAGLFAVPDGSSGDRRSYLLFSDETPADPVSDIVLARVGAEWSIGTYVVMEDEAETGALGVLIRPRGSEADQSLQEHTEDDVDVFASFVSTIDPVVGREDF